MALPTTLKEYIAFNTPAGVTPSPDLLDILIAKWENTFYQAFGIQTALKNEESSYTDNQLIFLGDLVSYDLINVFVNQVLVAIGANTVAGATSVSGGLKRVQTGPAEVEYFDIPNKANAEALALLLKDGGSIGGLQARICAQADQLRVKVYICNDFKTTQLPIIIRL